MPTAAALHVESADEAFHVGPSPATQSYLAIDRILEACRSSGAEAVHPGYGFLSENPAFVEAVEAAGLVFIGPPAAAIRAMGLKDAAKALMEQAGVPIVPGYHGDEQDADVLAERAAAIGYPVLIKARAGGGGKGMRRVDEPAAFRAALDGAQARGLGGVRRRRRADREISRTKSRHIEIQVFGDRHGNAVHLFERDCSLQRRHQKVIEEAPAPGMPDEMRREMGAAAVRAAKAIGYVGAGTVEFIADVSEGLRSDRFFFMEMNTRLQVEHPVTEAITGLDLVEWQLRVAAGEPLPLVQDEITLSGHAFEARVYAENPARGFLPSTGRLTRFDPPDGNVRVDSGVRQGDEVTPFYDPMIAKLIVHAPTRAQALGRLSDALARCRIAGVATNVGFLGRLCAEPSFAAGDVDTGIIDRGLACTGAGALAARRGDRGRGARRARSSLADGDARTLAGVDGMAAVGSRAAFRHARTGRRAAGGGDPASGSGRLRGRDRGEGASPRGAPAPGRRRRADRPRRSHRRRGLHAPGRGPDDLHGWRHPWLQGARSARCHARRACRRRSYRRADAGPDHRHLRHMRQPGRQGRGA